MGYDIAPFQPTLPTDILLAFSAASTSIAFTGPIHFLRFICDSPCDEARSMREFLNGNREGFDQPRGQIIVLSAINRWASEGVRTKHWKQATVRGYREKIFATFREAAQDSTLRLPLISTKGTRFPQATDVVPYPPLGTLDWPEFSDIPYAERDRYALTLVRSDALAVFEAGEKHFEFGQYIRATSDAYEGSWKHEIKAVKRLLQTEIDSWRSTKCSCFRKPWTNQMLSDAEHLTNPKFWEEMGIPWVTPPDPAHPGYTSNVKGLIADTIISCLGPNKTTTLAVQTIFNTDTGWNRQPIQRMSINPFIYQSAHIVRLGSARFMASFKERAGHFVVGSDTNSIARGMQLEALDALWDQLCSNPNYTDDADFATLDITSDLLAIMRRYERMTSAIREFCDVTTKQNYFIALVRSHKRFVKSPEHEIRNLPGKFASRAGVSFSSNRKSYLAIFRRNGASVEEARAAAGQYSTGVYETRYSDPASEKEHIDAARFYQNCVQAITLNRRLAFQIGLPLEDKEWFANFATRSGIRSAFGLSPKAVKNQPPKGNKAVRPDFVFVPCHDNYVDLYLTHKALKLAKTVIGHVRWEVQGAYLYMIVIEIARSLFKKGLRGEFRTSAKNARELLIAGQIALPPVLEV